MSLTPSRRSLKCVGRSEETLPIGLTPSAIASSKETESSVTKRSNELGTQVVPAKCLTGVHVDCSSRGEELL